MIPGLSLVRVLALQSFTKTTAHGQFHGDPDAEQNAQPMVPGYVVGELLASGAIALMETDQGEAGASVSLESNSQSAFEFKMTHKPVGQYVITGPGIEPETVRGKAAAEARLAELRAAAATASDDAPID